ncbi:copper chaperone PCu(A)C [uncultured Cohaesibacter sp.]|uniref:copper chaperone PCu(A)C n=1 Tax=uncultured Cohaesibacter sp. TaxID=1002546 RepID=UPI002AAB23DB|nr:copper chaperone PCu(A)C [uncultured Cohaesibacter sp.]
MGKRTSLALLLAFSASMMLLPVSINPALAQETGHDHAHEKSRHDEHHHADGEHSEHVSELHGMRSVHAWTRASSKGNDALVFVTLENESDQAILFKGGEFNHAQSVELVGFTMQDGKDVYVPLPQMPIEAGQKMVLAPKSLALRLSRIDEDLHKGDVIELHLLFDVGEMHVSVNVEAENAMHHSHAGHIHK